MIRLQRDLGNLEALQGIFLSQRHLQFLDDIHKHNVGAQLVALPYERTPHAAVSLACHAGDEETDTTLCARHAQARLSSWKDVSWVHINLRGNAIQISVSKLAQKA